MSKGIAGNVRIGTPRGISAADIRRACKNDPTGFMRKMEALVAEGKLRFRDISDIKSLFQALCGVKVPVTVDMMGAQRAIMATAFPVLAGTLAIAEINAGYDAVPTVGQALVREIQSNKRITTMARLATLDVDMEKVKEGDDFPEITATEDSVEIKSWRNGRLMRITAETIEENDVADIVNRLNKLGEIAAEHIEEQTLKRVCDYDGSAATPAEPYVYRPDGTGTTLFSATANTPGVRAPSGTRYTNNALADETDLENARGRLATMKNDRGKRIAIPYSEIVVLAPDVLMNILLKIKNSEMVLGTTADRSNWSAGGTFGGFQPISTPKVDDLSTTAWYYGAPKRQFVRKWKLNLEYDTLAESTEAYLRARIAFQARIAWDCEIGATDYVYWIQNLTATTSPKDD